MPKILLVTSVRAPCFIYPLNFSPLRKFFSHLLPADLAAVTKNVQKDVTKNEEGQKWLRVEGNTNHNHNNVSFYNSYNDL